MPLTAFIVVFLRRFLKVYISEEVERKPVEEWREAIVSKEFVDIAGWELIVGRMLRERSSFTRPFTFFQLYTFSGREWGKKWKEERENEKKMERE